MKAAILIVVVVACAIWSSECLSVNVMTTSGPVVGVQEGKYFAWKGIPYGKVSRWAPPQSPDPWTSPRQTTKPGPCCPQPPSDFFNMMDTANYNASDLAEDCLSLNVFAPVGASKLPVLVYIHGGGFVSGCGSRSRYFGNSISGMTPTIMVTLNYRLGVLGFLAGRELSGNFGMMDQQFALKWVQKNIAAFGGDPSRVTLDGQSAGGISVATHLAMPSTTEHKLISSAIIQSNPVLMQFRELKDQQPQYDTFSSAVGCGFAQDRLKCMRDLKWETLLAYQDYGALPLLLNNTWQNVIYKMPWAPTVDGHLIPRTPSAAFQSGKFHRVPVMIGSVANETTGFLPLVIGNNPWLANFLYTIGLDTLFGNSLASKIRKLYPSTRNTVEDGLGGALTDFAFICPTLQSANWISKYTPTYTYHMTHSPNCDPNNLHPICKGKVCHSADVNYVFHSLSLDDRGNCAWTPQENALSLEMMYAWTNFTSNPTGMTNLPKWNGNNVYRFDIPSGVSNRVGPDANCAFWYDVISGVIKS